jgi:hypothetical protein
MAVANTLAFYDTVTITAIKSFIVVTPVANFIQFFVLIYGFSQ